MKKILALCVFVLGLAFTTQVSAQTTEIEKKAHIKTEELRRTVKFNDEQKAQVYEVLQKYYNYLNRPNANESDFEMRKQKITAFVDEKLKAVLNEDQFAKFKQVKL
ncbi:hypothetical protein [Winogradskyella sp. 3972H.M.0a.05]|uniref:hypothetical protein n=1 Tax=Winogradskyella sp. 3972H.M.0a.05 TaxID=2950277 RepID=UPI003391A333